MPASGWHRDLRDHGERIAAVLGPRCQRCESETLPNTVVRFDRKTERFQSWAIPSGGNIVRNTDVTRDGNLVLASSLVNNVTLVKVPK